MPSFQTVRSKFDAVAEGQWERARAASKNMIAMSSAFATTLAGISDSRAGESAIKNLLPDAVGSLEVRFHG